MFPFTTYPFFLIFFGFLFVLHLVSNHIVECIFKRRYKLQFKQKHKTSNKGYIKRKLKKGIQSSLMKCYNLSILYFTIIGAFYSSFVINFVTVLTTSLRNNIDKMLNCCEVQVFIVKYVTKTIVV